MSEGEFFVVSTYFYQLHSHSGFLKNTSEGEGAWTLAKEDVLTDISYGFEL